MHIVFKITTATIIEDMNENYRLTLKFYCWHCILFDNG